MESSEHALLLAWRNGDRNAGSEIISRHVDALHRFFFNKVGDPQQLEELVQQTFAACVEGVDRFREDAEFRTWMFAIARNRLRKWIIERTKREAIDDEVDSVVALGVGPGSAVDAKRERRLLLLGLREIPVESQTILELYYWEDLSASQLGAVLGIPEGTARGRIRKAKLDLRAAIDRLARDRAELESTVGRLDDWARSLRKRDA
ncbi:MAG: sigma-70 family RNA polymerase sigma factor [Myxococcota bacterium]